MSKHGSCIEISEEQYPSVYKTFVQCCNILDISNVPKLYISGTRNIDATVDGIQEPVVLITEGAIEALSEEELKFLFGNVLGDIKANHLLYHKVVDLLQNGVAEIIGNIAIGVKIALLSWYRASLFSSDRAGLLCCQSKDVAISCLAKTAGFYSYLWRRFQY